jgi:pimeloyl-ACP methyl ester carboxylesterase
MGWCDLARAKFEQDFHSPENGPAMTDTASTASDDASPSCSTPPIPLEEDPYHVVVGRGEGYCNFAKSTLEVIMQLPLPGIVIFVHGVNSDGEWYDEAEAGLCKGLNERLKRDDEYLAFKGKPAGQLSATPYIDELTADGYINPDMDAATFIHGDDTFSPVIRFRWGYKASGEELQEYGDGIYLNERNYWGGGPFANGCTTLPDLWGKGLAENMFLFVNVEHLNPDNSRQVYTCPPRPYFVLAALRLARLVESIRKKQADVPITIVSHSQGTMVAMASAFLGDRLPPVTDGAGYTGSCVADNYVLCSSPYSVLEKNGVETWCERNMEDAKGRTGRQTGQARIQTLAAFFDIVRQRKPLQQNTKRIDRRMANEAHGFTAALDRTAYGVDGSTYGRVTLYCNPHDQVISSVSIQGMGWRGLDQKEIAAAKGEGMFTQRVFAQGFEVGKKGTYNYWHKLKPGSQAYWYPQSLPAIYDVKKGLASNKNVLAKIATFLFSPLLIAGTKLAGMRIHALPPNTWTIPLDAPDLPPRPDLLPFMPKAKRFGVESDRFDEGSDAPGEARDPLRAQTGSYAGNRAIPRDGTEAVRINGGDAAEETDAAKGNRNSEAALRYEHHGQLRMQARREGLVKKGEAVTAEDKPETASPEYTAWHNEKIKTSLAANVKTSATDHSTILTNGMHSERALAYDVAIGNCDISETDMRAFRIAADWRFSGGLDDGDPHKAFHEYFVNGIFQNKTIFDWANPASKGPGTNDRHDGSMPAKIVDQRSYARTELPVERDGA